MKRTHMWIGSLMILSAAGCALLQTGSLLPSKRTWEQDQIVVHSEFSLPKRHRLLDELVVLRSDVYQQLDLSPSDEPINVFLFDSSAKYQKFLRSKFPELPDRRAFFVETDTRLAVYAYWGDFVSEDLRHEVTHGYLHAVVREIPLWLDEGLAEFFETPRSAHGFHSAHANALSEAFRNGWRPNLLRLEQLAEADEMSLRDYEECWLWVHMLLRSTPERLHLARTYLNNLRSANVTLPMSESLRQLENDPNGAVLYHLDQLARNGT